MPRPSFVLMLLAALLLTSLAGDASARRRTRVEWVKVSVRPGDDARRVAQVLEKELIKSSRRAKWGNGPQLKLSAHVKRLAWESRGEDVVRVSVTVVARIKGGKGARSHIRVGGHPKERRKLEKQALGIVANGLVTRLSAIARRQAKALEDQKKKKEQEGKDES